MHIGFDAKRAFLNNTGLGNYSRFTINALCRSYPDNQYSLFTPSTGNDQLYIPPGACNTIVPGNLWKGGLKSYWRTYGLPRLLSREKINLYHGLSNELPFGMDKTGARSVVTIHDLIFLRHPELYRAIDRRIYQKKVNYAVKAADRIIAISRQTRDDLVELTGADPDKIRVVYQGCNPWFYDKVSDDVKQSLRVKYNLPEQFLLYVGTIEPRKNLLQIIKAMHLSSIEIPLVAVGGKTPYYNQIQQYIEENNITNIQFYQRIENQDLPGVYQMAEAFVYPSSYEGFGIPVLEALNSGIPVVTSRGGCLEETAGNGALLVDPMNTEELGTAINRVLSDNKLRQQLVRDGKKHALSFREEKTIASLYEVYQELM